VRVRSRGIDNNYNDNSRPYGGLRGFHEFSHFVRDSNNFYGDYCRIVLRALALGARLNGPTTTMTHDDVFITFIHVRTQMCCVPVGPGWIPEERRHKMCRARKTTFSPDNTNVIVAESTGFSNTIAMMAVRSVIFRRRRTPVAAGRLRSEI